MQEMMLSRLKRKEYEAALEPLQRELVELARWVSAEKKRIVVVIEGRDSAGKGGAIAAIRQHLNPRQVRTVALAKPTEREAGQWYFQRYVEHLPTAGEIVLFDRSWYNRAGVEQVMGYASQDQVDAFFVAVPSFEQMLVDDGIILLKYWLCCDQAKQEKRFAERHKDPLKGWKLSPIDVKAREQYDAYTQAREVMLAATHLPAAPWYLVDFNDQKVGRLTLIRSLLDRIPDHRVAEEKVDLPPLEGKLSTESYSVVEPLKDY
ncbi:MAG: polyphosphate kinase 2 [Novosphingobium sp.]